MNVPTAAVSSIPHCYVKFGSNNCFLLKLVKFWLQTVTVEPIEVTSILLKKRGM